MALNLKKDETPSEENKPSEEKKLKFDLSKKDITPSASEPEISDSSSKGGSNKWGLLIILVVVIGGATWYFAKTDAATSNSAAESNTTVDTTATVKEEANSQVVAADTVAAAPAATAAPVVQAAPDNSTANNANTISTASSKKNTPASSPKNATSLANKNTPIANFASGSSSQTAVENSVLSEIQKKIKNNPNAQILLEGYASSEGDLDYNVRLSQDRANSLKAYLVSQGVPEKNIIAKGMGIQNPIASNDTEAGRKKNRRVEVK
jgi:outer membrane protein OmpA-like peptidoglycan-associated protein